MFIFIFSIFEFNLQKRLKIFEFYNPISGVMKNGKIIAVNQEIKVQQSKKLTLQVISGEKLIDILEKKDSRSGVSNSDFSVFFFLSFSFLHEKFKV